MRVCGGCGGFLVGESLMTVERVQRAELLAIYDDLCGLWKRAVRLDENFLAYLLELSLIELREKLGADLPMPVHPSAQEPKRRRG